jgi:glycosyltransferase involved in cell wall biosynthesis
MENVTNKKPKILLLSDDLRMSSGIATMSREIVMGTVDRFDWFQVAAAIKNPDYGKLLDLSEDVRKRTGISDASVKLLPWNGYGNADLIRQLINSEKPDAILHFTDPRYWTWLYEIEHEIRQNVPIIYYTIWDDLPNPLYNSNYYASCDSLLCISKQTYGIVNNVLTEVFGDEFNIVNESNKEYSDTKRNIMVKYVPHGIDSNSFKPTEVPTEFKKEIFGDKEYEFVLFWANRNIRRKQPSDVIWAFNRFCEIVGKDIADKCVLVMHTSPIDENGTDLITVKNVIAPNANIIFSAKRRPNEELNYLYNLANVTINIAGNEGFGLTTAESVMAGTPIIVNVTGGLQDQCGFKLKDSNTGFTADDYVKIGSLHDWRLWEGEVNYGNWVIPVWSRARSLAGSVPTPYIWDDRVDLEEVAETIVEFYNMGKAECKKRGVVGRDSFMNEMNLDSKHMCDMMADGITETIKNWKPSNRFNIYKVK